jgi:hypothetical protein
MKTIKMVKIKSYEFFKNYNKSDLFHRTRIEKCLVLKYLCSIKSEMAMMFVDDKFEDFYMILNGPGCQDDDLDYEPVCFEFWLEAEDFLNYLEDQKVI